MTAVDSHLDSIRWLQDTREYSDLRIICGDEIFHVHKAIVCSRSKWFRTACKLEWGTNDKCKGEIRLDDEDSIAVGLMLDYLYQMDYDDTLPSRRVAELRNEVAESPNDAGVGSLAHDTSTDNGALHEPESNHTAGNYWGFGQSSAPMNDSNLDPWDASLRSAVIRKKKKKYRSPSPEPGPEISYQPADDSTNLNTERLPVNALMYVLADKYDIEHLRALAKLKFEQAARESFSAEAFAHAAHLVFATVTTDDGLRSIIVDILSRHHVLIEYDAVASLLRSENEMGWSLIQALVSRMKGGGNF